MMTSFHFIYMTAPTRDEANRIGRVLVEEGLAACVNILDGMTSIYRWQGKIEEDDEVVLIAKTRADQTEALTARVVELHPYDCPCVIALPIVDGHSAYLSWLGM